MSGDTRHGICTFCDSVCGLEFDVAADQITAIRGDTADVFSRGHICPKGIAQQEIHHDPDRLTEPLQKVKGEWEPISWPRALALLADRIVDCQQRHGKDGFGFYFGNPVGHDYKAMFGVLAMQGVLGTRNIFSSNSIDAHPRMLASLQLYGNQALLPIPDIERTDLLVVMGANPVISHGSVMTAPDTRKRLQEIRARGGRILVIDPRRSETAAIADAHIAIRPGSDALLLLSVIHELDVAGLVSWRARDVADGVDQLLQLARDFPAERTAAATGIEPGVVRMLAREFGRARAAAWYGRMGTCTQTFGCLSTWLIDAVNVLTGNLDRPGGIMFATPAVDLAGLTRRIRQTGSFARWRSRVGGLPEYNGELPVAALADEIETAGPGQIRSMLIFAGNPVLSNPNGRRLAQALDSLDFLACIDFYLNETTRHADLILPPCGPLEKAHYPVLELSMGVRNVARYAPAIMPTDRPDDFAIIADLMRAVLDRRGGLQRLAGVALGAGLSLIKSEQLLDLLLRTGPHHLSLDAVKAARHGIDLGPLESRLQQVLATNNGRVQLFPDLFVADLDRLRTRLDEADSEIASRPFSLVSRRTMSSMNSWLHNSPLLTRGRDRCTLQMHSADARRIGVAAGGRVRVSSAAGSLDVPVEVTDVMMPGVVSMPFGWGHDKVGSRLHNAAQHAGVSMNDVVDEHDVDGVSGTSVLDGIPVQIEALAA